MIFIRSMAFDGRRGDVKNPFLFPEICQAALNSQKHSVGAGHGV